jgi:hypothetical protein
VATTVLSSPIVRELEAQPFVRRRAAQSTAHVRKLDESIVLVWVSNAVQDRLDERDLGGALSHDSWQQLTQQLASRLPRFEDGDTVILRHGGRYTQVQQRPNGITVEAVSNHLQPPDRCLSADQERQLERRRCPGAAPITLPGCWRPPRATCSAPPGPTR